LGKRAIMSKRMENDRNRSNYEKRDQNGWKIKKLAISEFFLGKALQNVEKLNMMRKVRIMTKKAKLDEQSSK
jgi:hypothetical protein